MQDMGFIFKVVLSIIDKDIGKNTPWSVFISIIVAIVAIVVIYGLWNWI